MAEEEAGEDALCVIIRARALVGRPRIRSLGSIHSQPKNEVVSFLCDGASEKRPHEFSQDDVATLLAGLPLDHVEATGKKYLPAIKGIWGQVSYPLARAIPRLSNTLCPSNGWGCPK